MRAVLEVLPGRIPDGLAERKTRKFAGDRPRQVRSSGVAAVFVVAAGADDLPHPLPEHQVSRRSGTGW
jgi:hypothetical protein